MLSQGRTVEKDHRIRRRSASTPGASLSLLDGLSWAVVVTATLVLPVTIQFGSLDTFRFPKELLLRGEAILLIGLATIKAIFRRHSFDRGITRDPLVYFATAGVIWAVAVTATSTFPLASLYSLVYIVSLFATFILTMQLAGTRSLSSAALVFPAASINCIVFILQHWHVWNPFIFGYGTHEHLTLTGLVGNPDDLAAYLCAPALAAVAFSCLRTRWRPAALITAILMILCVSLTSDVTAIIAALFGIMTIVIAKKARFVRLVVLLAVVASIATPRARAYLVTAVQHAKAHDWNAIISNRLAAWHAAILMASDHPLVGVGPGRFHWHYYSYKFEAEAHEPRLLRAATREINFTEVHNDYLQLAAEGGIIAPILGVAVLMSLAARRMVRNHSPTTTDLRAEFAGLLAPGLAVSLALLMVGFFPLELAAPTTTHFYLAALCAAWRPLRVP